MKTKANSIWLRTSLLFFVISLVFFISLLMIFYINSEEKLKNQASQAAMHNLEIIELLIDSRLENIASTAQNLAADEEAIFGEKSDVEAILKKNEDMGGMAGVRMVIEGDDIISVMTSARNYAVVADAAPYRQMSRKDRLVIAGPYYSPQSAYRSICAIRSVVNAEGTERLVICEASTLAMFGTPKIKSNSSLIVLAQGGETIYMDAYSPLFEKQSSPTGLLDISDALRVTLMSIETNSAEVSVGSAQLLIHRISYDRGWQLFMLTDRASFYREVNEISRFYLVVAGIAIAVLTSFSMLVSYLALHPVRVIAKRMDGMSANEPIKLYQNQRHDEIGILWRSFGRLMERLYDSAQKETQMANLQHELEYKVLQSQIQPHFLFNIHACIDLLLRKEEIEKARLMLADLDVLLRTSIDRKEVVSLREEIDLSERYLRLLRMRMGDFFDYSFENWEESADISVPKLLFQPLLENAIYHGLMDLDYRGEIRLTVTNLDGNLHIVIEDNGRGITPAGAKEDNDVRRHGMGSIGIDNIRQRITLFYGQRGEMYISSREGLGTRVEIVIKA